MELWEGSGTERNKSLWPKWACATSKPNVFYVGCFFKFLLFKWMTIHPTLGTFN